ncbi:MAG TPA: nuclear transport factor 2 family protein [Pyrinomonadaceae bacterium]|nr:nuclear transport factor 2 family protein [Pyrinomonadaceae bacterium]
MKRFVIAAFLLTTFCLPVLAHKKSGPDFNHLIKEYYAAWSTLNPDNPAPAYAKDTDLVFFDVDPLKYTSWQQYHDNFKNNVAPGFTSLTITPNNDIKTTRSGSLAFSTLTFHLSAKTKDGSPLEFEGRHTIVWQLRAGKWLIIHEHVSKPLS